MRHLWTQCRSKYSILVTSGVHVQLSVQIVWFDLATNDIIRLSFVRPSRLSLINIVTSLIFAGLESTPPPTLRLITPLGIRIPRSVLIHSSRCTGAIDNIAEVCK